MADTAVFNLPPPDSFLPLPGEPIIPWSQWKKSFEQYLLATGLDTASSARKRAILLHLLGAEGNRIFNSLDGTLDTYAATITALDGHFKKSRNTLFRRLEFRQRSQRPGESARQFVTDLKALAQHCNFGTMRDELIRDQLIEKTSYPRVQEELLLKDDTLKLEDALTLALQIETATSCAAKIAEGKPHTNVMDNKSTALLGQSVQPVQVENPLQPAAVQVARPQQTRPQRRCGNCGSNRHATRAQDCPARGQTCRRCQKPNHFAKCCRSAPADYPGQSHDSVVPVRTVGPHPVTFSRCPTYLDGCCVPLLLDTGAKVSLLNVDTCKLLFPNRQLLSPSTALCGYGRSKIDVVGLLYLPVRYASVSVNRFPFHITRHGENIMGLDLFLSLGFTLHDNSGTQILQVTSPWQQRRPELFDGLGCLTAFTHKPLLDHSVPPVVQPLRRIPLALREGVTQELTRLQGEGIIEPIDASPWVSNLVIAKKKSGGLRVCVDLRQVNKAVVPDKYPLPTTEELTTHFYGSKVFSKLDLRQGYLQIPLHPDRRDLTAFITHTGLYRYTRMAFGLSSAPSCFQKIMSTILASCPGTVAFLDDIVVHGPDTDTHNARLERVFASLSRHHVTLNTEKCVFAAPAIDFVGFRVSAEGISPLQSNVAAISAVPAPTTASQLASFLGMTAYYMRFLPQYSTVTAPLRMLLKHDAPWVWTPDCQAAFDDLKQLLTTSPVLAHFQLECPTVVTCDASAVALGAVLSQFQDGVEKPVAFASRALSPTEQKYSVGEREALACIWACERWHLYLYGRSFTLRTDHQALTTLMSASGGGHRPLRLHRWSDRLQQYDFQLQFMPGKSNVVADFLSRPVTTHCPAPSPADEQDTVHCSAVFTEDEEEILHLVHSPLKDTVSLQDLESASAAEPTFSRLRDYIRHGWPAHFPPELEPYHRVKNELSCWGEACIARGVRAVIPASLRECVLQMAHQGHLGVVKIKQRCRETVWWPAIDRALEDLTRDCNACLTSGKTGLPTPTPLQPIDWPSAPWDHLQLDICGELPNVPHHQRFLVVVYDLHSKWPEVAPMGTVTSAAVIDFLNQLFSRWGLPRAITTDNGPQFLSSEFTTFLANNGVTHIRTSIYHPQANGGVERFNRSLKNGLRAHMAEGYSLKAALSQTLLHYRATIHSTTGVSPAALMLKRELVLPLSRLRPPMATAPRPGPAAVKAHVKRQQHSMKQRFDKKHRTKWPTIQVSDWVRARRPHRANKLSSFWSAPCQVTRQLGPASFQLTDGSRWHASCLRRVPSPLHQPHLTGAVPRPHLTGAQRNSAAEPMEQINPATEPAPPVPDLAAALPAPPPVPDPAAALPAAAVPPAARGLASPSASLPVPLAPEPRPVRARTRPGHFEDFVATFHV